MKLTAEQIAVLEAQSCRCENWSEVTVADFGVTILSEPATGWTSPV